MQFVVSGKVIVRNYNELNDYSHAKNQLKQLAVGEEFMYLFEYHVFSFYLNQE